jgi:chemotaxis protein MotA
MDLGTIIGILAGNALILSAMLMGGTMDMFINIPGLMIVFGGALAACLMAFQLKDVIAAFKAAMFVITGDKMEPNAMVQTMCDLCTVTRKSGLVALSKMKFEEDFLRKAANLIADGTKEEVIRDALTIEIDAMKSRHAVIQDVFMKLAAYSPAFGMIGTLIGLVQMLANLSDPAAVGPAMAVALLTTLYGTMFANMLFNPIAAKLQSRTMTEVMNLEITFEGACAILAEGNPMTVYEKLSSFIPGRERTPLEKKKKK